MVELRGFGVKLKDFGVELRGVWVLKRCVPCVEPMCGTEECSILSHIPYLCIPTEMARKK